MKYNKQDELPVSRKKKALDITSFVRLARRVRQSFEQEEKQFGQYRPESYGDRDFLRVLQRP